MNTSDFVNGANAISNIITALNGVGVTGTAQTGILAQINQAINPSKTAELAACTSMMNFAAIAPARVGDVAKTLEIMQGMPVGAQGLCENLISLTSDPAHPANAAVLDQIILQIESIINSQ